MQWLTVTINDEFTITNIYKPPSAAFPPPPINSYPAIYSEDFNSCHKLWGYMNNEPDGAALDKWASNNDLNPLYDQNNQRHFIRLSGTLSLTQILHSTRLMLIISLHIRHIKSVKISQDPSIAQPSLQHSQSIPHLHQYQHGTLTKPTGKNLHTNAEIYARVFHLLTLILTMLMLHSKESWLEWQRNVFPEVFAPCTYQAGMKNLRS